MNVPACMPTFGVHGSAGQAPPSVIKNSPAPLGYPPAEMPLA